MKKFESFDKIEPPETASDAKDGQPSTSQSSNEPKTSLVKPFKEKQSNEGQKTKEPYPKSVIFIIGNEFCERFSYYGMKTILVLYFVNKLGWDDDFSTMIYHVFAGGCYFTPILGAIISDSFLGKFRTILYISIVYTLGNIVLAVSALPTIGFDKISVQAIGMLGLALIAFGTGGIKPCVSAFGGDQFSANQEKQLQRFFSFFYISINAGSLLSTFITPMLRSTPCLNEKDCFSLAFGVPAILMVAALILFILGRKLYKVVPPQGNILVEVFSCICYALKKKCQSKGVKRESWLDYADDKYDRSLIQDIKPVLRVMFLYLPLPFYWALFDQQGSRWTLQATRLDGTLSETVRVQPDQMQVVNPLLIILCIPIFEYLIYPAFAKIHFLVRPLQRMTVGGLITAGAFVVAFFLQLAIEKTMPIQPDSGYGRLNVFNGFHCPLEISLPNDTVHPLNSEKPHIYEEIAAEVTQILHVKTKCPGVEAESQDYSFSIESRSVEILFISRVNGKLYFMKIEDSYSKPEKGDSDVRVVFNNPGLIETDNHTFVLDGPSTKTLPVKDFNESTVGSTPYKLVTPGRYSLSRFTNEQNETTFAGEFVFKSGGAYIIVVSATSDENSLTAVQHQMVEPNTISLFLQIPQYVLLTWGEVMFSITGLEFSYSQAPVSMKAVLQAGWLLTVGFGNVIVVIVSKSANMKQSTEFIMFACLLAVVMGIFAVMAYFYVPVVKSEEGEKNGHPVMNGKGKKNEAFVDDNTTKM